MGVYALQDFVESHCPKACKQVEVKDFVKARQTAGSKAVIVIDAMSCVRYLYGYNTDWVCGGQWNEMLRNIENFVRSFRQQNSEIVAFLPGEGDSLKLHEWIKTEEKHRQTVHRVLSHVMRQANFPPKRLFFLPPAAHMCLRMAFRSCGVSVCCSLVDLHKELVTYCKDRRYSGIIGHHGDYILLDPPAYMSAEQLTFSKKSITTVQFDLEMILNDVGLEASQRGLFASLLGNSFIPEEHLAAFHWALIGSDPMAKKQTNGQTVLPPNNVVIRSLVTYVNQVADVSNYAWIASQVFSTDKVNMEEMTDRLRQSIEYYPGSQSTGEDELKPKGRGKNEHQYQKLWQHWQQHQSIPRPVATSYNKMAEEEHPNDVIQLQEHLSKLSVENGNNDSGEQTPPSSPSIATPKSPMATPEVPGEAASPSTPALQGQTQVTPPASIPTPPPSEEASPEPKPSMISHMGYTAVSQSAAPEVPTLRGIIKTITPQVLNTVFQRHQSGQMSEMISQILTKAEVTVSAALEDEHNTDMLPTPILFRPIRQIVYGLLFDKKAYDRNQGTMPHDPPPIIKEWCVYGGKKLNKPDLVEGVVMDWNIPELHPLWFGKQATDDLDRMKAFLTCMQSDTPNMTKTTMVPQRLVIMCCVLRYLLKQSKCGHPVLLANELDAFLASALSPHISTECNPSNLSGLKLIRVELRGVQLASIFMRGVEAATLANDACGSPVPWELVCPWNYFDGKLFMSKYVMTASDVSQLDLCDGKNARLEKLQRMRWCITEGIAPELLGMRLPTMGVRFPGAGLLPTPPSPFYPLPPYLQGIPIPNTNFIPAGASIPPPPPLADRPRTRGASSKRPVSGLGGTLEVAGVPVAKWGGNKAGRGYDERSRIIAGGPMSVEIPPKGHFRGRRGGQRGGCFTRTRNVTWAMEVDKEYDRRIGYKAPHPQKRAANISLVREGGDGGNDVLIHRGRGDGGSDPENITGEPPITTSTYPAAITPVIGIHVPAMQPPMVQTFIDGRGVDKTPVGQVHILVKPTDKLSGQGRGRGLPTVTTTNNIGGLPDGQMAGKGRGWWLEKAKQQTPAT